MDLLKRIAVPAAVIPMALLWLSCSSQIYRTVYPTLSDGKYDSEFPYRNSSEQLEKIGETIHLVNCIATYQSYILPQGSALRRGDLTSDIVEKTAEKVQYVNTTSSGTATVVYARGYNIAVLTCAHIVSFPDTLITYFADRTGLPTEYVQSVAFRRTQLNYIADLPENSQMEVLAVDATNDLAVLGKSFEKPHAVAVFDYPLGHAKELEWGSFVYMFGYPLTNKMVTKAIVSSPNKDIRGSFILDAVFNRGFSGGIVLAIRDGVPNFELVGMVSSVPADYENDLAPAAVNQDAAYDETVPYRGDIFVRRRVNIKYGVTRAISAETVKDFIERNKSLLESKGYNLDSFIESRPAGLSGR